MRINFYIKAQKELGAAKTSAYYSVAPFLGVLFGVLLLGERPGLQFYLGLAIMIAATVLMVKDTITLQHTHEHSHIHSHTHGTIEGHNQSHVEQQISRSGNLPDLLYAVTDACCKGCPGVI